MIVCQGVTRMFPRRPEPVRGLEDVSFEVAAGEFVAIKGPSGSGKSTLLLTVGAMQRPTRGTVRLSGQDVYALSPAERAGLRARSVGFVFQLFHLVPYLTALENVLIGLPDAPDPARARALLDELGLSARAGHKPSALSAGEKQRVALARALVKKPAVLLADEPTGNLDPENAGIVFQHLAAYHRAGGTVMIVTHGPDADPFATRQLRLAGGRLDVRPSSTSSSPSPGSPLPSS